MNMLFLLDVPPSALDMQAFSGSHNEVSHVHLSKTFLKTDPVALESLIKQQSPPVTCLVVDLLVPVFAPQLAENLGLPMFILCTASAASLAALIRSAEVGGDPKQLTSIVGGPTLDVAEVNPFLTFCGRAASDFMCNFFTHVFREKLVKASDTILVNTCEELEGSTLEHLRKMNNVRAIGPLLPEGGSLWAEDKTCLDWLDKQPESSVLFVSFGSLASLSTTQLLELALGLEASKQRILWVARPDLIHGKAPGLTHRHLSLSIAQVKALENVKIVQAAIGGWHCLAVDADGCAYAWGGNEYGQCAEPPEQKGETKVFRQDVVVPRRCAPHLRVRQVAAGGTHSVVCSDDGRVWTWGQPWPPRDIKQMSTPVRVQGLENVKLIAVGAFHNLALLDHGEVWAWGNNEYGQLGTGDTQPRALPVAVNGLVGLVMVHIAAGGWHSMALTPNGQVGSVSDERMLGLLDSALVADTINTVRMARELVDSGVEPLSLISRLATLITDILAGSFKLSDKQGRAFFRKQTLLEVKLERLRIAMKTLSEAEKQLRTSNDRTTWLIAALLQLGPDRSFMFPASCPGTSVTQSPIALDENEVVEFEHRSSGRQTLADGDGNISQNLVSEFVTRDDKSGHSYGVHAREKANWTKVVLFEDLPGGKALPETFLMQVETPPKSLQGLEKEHYEIELLDEAISSAREKGLSPSKLDDIWRKVVERCQSNPLRQLLYASVKLISISISEGTKVYEKDSAFIHDEEMVDLDELKKSTSVDFSANPNPVNPPIKVDDQTQTTPGDDIATANEDEDDSTKDSPEVNRRCSLLLHR